MTRLTNKIKEDIINNWVSAKKKDLIHAAFVSLGVQYAELISKVYSENRNVYLDNKELSSHGYVTTIESATLPYAFQQRVIDCRFIRGVLSMNDNSLGRKSFNIDKIAINSRYFEISRSIKPDRVKPLFDRFMKKIDAISADIDKVSNLLYSVTTVKKLIDILPKFTKYIPEEEQKTTQLISIDTVNEVKKLL